MESTWGGRYDQDPYRKRVPAVPPIEGGRIDPTGIPVKWDDKGVMHWEEAPDGA